MKFLSVPGRRRNLAIICLALFLSTNVKYTHASEKKNGTRPVEILKFTTGIIAAFSIHEASHLLTAEATGNNIEWESGTINQPIGFTENSKKDSDGIIILSSGLVSQIIGSEIILQTDKIDKNSSFVRGMMAWNILNPISYSLDYWFVNRSNKKVRNSYTGDIQGIEHYSGKNAANCFAVSMIAIAAFQGYRFFKTQSWSTKKIQDKSHSIFLAPVSSNGYLLGYGIRF